MGNTLSQIDTGNNFMNVAQQLREMGVHETKNLLHSKGNSHYTEETAFRIGKNLRRVLITRIYKKLKKTNLLNNQQPTEQMGL
jgi:hypothetical protein